MTDLQIADFWEHLAFLLAKLVVREPDP